MTDQELKDLLANLVKAQAKTEADNAAGFAALREAQAKTGVLIAASDARVEARLSKLTANIESVNKQLGGIANNQGAVAEEFFYNSLSEMPTVGGIRYDQVFRNLEGGNKKSHAEFDIVLVNGKSVALIEVKYKYHPADVDKAEQLLGRFRELMPAYKDYTLYGGIAGFSVPNDAVEAAHEKGLFVLKRSGDIIEADTEGMKAF